jgi:general L-amino acid transport system substrate-binding protein
MVTRRAGTGVSVLCTLLVAVSAWAGPVLTGVQSRGILRCGVSEGIPGFSLRGADGRWTGLDADFCRAVAAAALGDPGRVDFVPLTAAGRFPALKSGRIDLLARTTTRTLGREANLGTQFAGTLYYDGQGFLVAAANTAERPEDLAGQPICVAKGSTHEVNLADYFQARGLVVSPVVVDSILAAVAGIGTGQCAAVTSDATTFAELQRLAPGGAAAYRLLPARISKEPFGPVVNRGDEGWLTLVRWVLFALVEAEERGITAANARGTRDTTADPAVKAFLGAPGDYSVALGVKAGWVLRAVEAVGNFGEMFERNLGRESRLNIDRGLNRLWTDGGLMYAPPFR